ncbi:MAG: hypothetical protein ACJ783_09160 [Myxococcales bacterium]
MPTGFKEIGMAFRIPVLALIVACQATPQEVSSSSLAGERREASPAVELTVHLVELTEGPGPTGLPMNLAIKVPGLPGSGERVDVVWNALDGAAAPREGSGTIEIDADGRRATVKLSAPDRAANSVLTLSGSIAGANLAGKFTDRLFSPRAGRFDARIREK